MIVNFLDSGIVVEFFKTPLYFLEIYSEIFMLGKVLYLHLLVCCPDKNRNYRVE